MAARILGDLGYEVLEAASGVEAIEVWEQHGRKVALLLVDLVMPDMNGIEVCRRINELRPTLDNPIAVLMLTGRENKEDLTRALEAGAEAAPGKRCPKEERRWRVIRERRKRKSYAGQENGRPIEHQGARRQSLSQQDRGAAAAGKYEQRDAACKRGVEFKARPQERRS